MYGETFYGRHTAQHQLQWSQIKYKNKFLSEQWTNSKKVDGPYYISFLD